MQIEALCYVKQRSLKDAADVESMGVMMVETVSKEKGRFDLNIEEKCGRDPQRYIEYLEGGWKGSNTPGGGGIRVLTLFFLIFLFFSSLAVWCSALLLRG